VVAVVLVPAIWDAVWTGEMINTTGTDRGVNGTTWTLVQLTPMLYVALVIIVGTLLASGYRIPGT